MKVKDTEPLAVLRVASSDPPNESWRSERPSVITGLLMLDLPVGRRPAALHTAGGPDRTGQVSTGNCHLLLVRAMQVTNKSQREQTDPEEMTSSTAQGAEAATEGLRTGLGN